MRSPEQIAEIREKALPIVDQYHEQEGTFLAACIRAYEALENAGERDAEDEEDDKAINREIELATMVYYLLCVEEIGK